MPSFLLLLCSWVTLMPVPSSVPSSLSLTVLTASTGVLVFHEFFVCVGSLSLFFFFYFFFFQILLLLLLDAHTPVSYKHSLLSKTLLLHPSLCPVKFERRTIVRKKKKRIPGKMRRENEWYALQQPLEEKDCLRDERKRSLDLQDLLLPLLTDKKYEKDPVPLNLSFLPHTFCVDASEKERERDCCQSVVHMQLINEKEKRVELRRERMKFEWRRKTKEGKNWNERQEKEEQIRFRASWWWSRNIVKRRREEDTEEIEITEETGQGSFRRRYSSEEKKREGDRQTGMRNARRYIIIFILPLLLLPWRGKRRIAKRDSLPPPSLPSGNERWK